MLRVGEDDSRLRLCGHCDRHSLTLLDTINIQLYPASLPLQGSVTNVLSVRAVNADHSGLTDYGMNRLHPLVHWDRVFESHSKHGCLCAFILC
jgi:hypothetical protein